MPVSSLVAPVRSYAVAGRAAPACRRLQDGRQIVFRQGENDRDRLELGDDDNAVGIARLHVIAGIDLAQPDPPADRRDDVAVDEVELLGVDLRLIGLNGADILLHQRRLRVEDLPGDRVFRDQGAVARQIDLGILEQRLIFCQLPFGLLERDLVGTRIDLSEKIALVDDLAFLEGDFGQLAGDLGLDRHRRERGDRTEPAEHDRHIALADLGRADRHRARRLEAPGRGRLVTGAQHHPGHQSADNKEDKEEPERAVRPGTGVASGRGPRRCARIPIHIVALVRRRRERAGWLIVHRRLAAGRRRRCGSRRLIGGHHACHAE